MIFQLCSIFNPSDGNVTLSATHEGDAIKVSDMFGNIVWEGQGREIQTHLELSYLPLGMYVVNCNEHVIKMIKK
ncbi:MAG: hypothetical protein JWO58_2384 [Chitinophagaceae bacterium]|nr:hypothetical protein [Chitinophagaceae bacterium]